MIRWVRSALESGKRRLAGRTKVKASIYYASASVICQFLRFTALMVSTRLIDAREFGIFAQAILALSFTNFVREVGQNNALVSYSGEDRRFTVFNFQINLVLGCLGGLGLLLVLTTAPGIPEPLRRIAPLLAVMALNETLIYTAMVVSQQRFHFRLIGLADISALVVYLLTVVVTVNRLEGFQVLVLAQFTEVLTRLLILGAGERWCFLGWCNGRDLRAYYFGRFAPMWVPLNLLQTAAGRVDYMLFGAFGSLYELGVYERMLQFIRIPQSLSLNLLDRVLMASYSKEQKSGVAVRQMLRKSRLLILLASVLAALATTFGILFVLDRIVGPSWAATIRHYWWAALPFSILPPLVGNHNLLLQGTGNPKYLLAVTAFVMVGELALGSTVLAYGYGISGMFIARAVVQVLAFTLQYAIIGRLYGVASLHEAASVTANEPQRVNSNIPQA